MEMKLEDFSKCIKLLISSYPHLVDELNKVQLKLWYELLKDLSVEQLLSAVSTFCSSHTEVYPGTNIVAYIRKYAFYDPDELSVGEAWGLVKRDRLNRSIYDKSPKKPIPYLVEKAFEAIGGMSLLNSENIVADRARFFEVYKDLVQREEMKRMRGFGDNTVDGLKSLISNDYDHEKK